MKVYFSQTDHPKIVGVAQGIELLVPESYFWHKDQMSLFDLIQEKKPSAIFLNDGDDKDHVRYAKHEFPETKFVLLTETGDTPEGFDLVLNLKDPNAEWYVPYLANEVTFGNGKPNDQYKCDFVLFSNRLDGNNKAMLKWLSAIGNKYHFKIYGTHRLPIPYYLGRPVADEYKSILQSTKAVIMMDGEWFYDTIKADKIPLLFSREKNNPWEFDQYEEIIELCDKVLADDAEIKDWKDKLAKEAKDKTYTHLATKIKEELGI